MRRAGGGKERVAEAEEGEELGPDGGRAADDLEQDLEEEAREVVASEGSEGRGCRGLEGGGRGRGRSCKGRREAETGVRARRGDVMGPGGNGVDGRQEISLASRRKFACEFLS